jgi:hypothetical protein
MVKPTRVQLSRKRGYRKPDNTVVVTRATKWGNPYKLADYPSVMPEPDRRAHALRSFRGVIMGEIEDPIHRLPFTVDDVRRELRGKNLACFCPLDKPCHADVLLEIANTEDS